MAHEIWTVIDGKASRHATAAEAELVYAEARCNRQNRVLGLNQAIVKAGGPNPILNYPMTEAAMQAYIRITLTEQGLL